MISCEWVKVMDNKYHYYDNTFIRTVGSNWTSHLIEGNIIYIKSYETWILKVPWATEEFLYLNTDLIGHKNNSIFKIKFLYHKQ